MKTLLEDFNEIKLATEGLVELLLQEPETYPCDTCTGKSEIDIGEVDDPKLVPCPECRAGFYEARIEEIDQDR